MPTHATNIRAHAAFIAVAAILALQGCGGPATAKPAEAAGAPATYVAAVSDIEAGRYLVKIGGCNDCHTPGFAMTNGASPAEDDWLTGDAVGFSGPWGVSYPSNLRLSFQNMTEDQFLELSRAGEGRPPMPWPSLKAMSDKDLKAIYAYINALGPKGEPAPAALSPGVAPDRPHIPFVPQPPAQG
jgi:mono/diheme cytochrome c family protein